LNKQLKVLFIGTYVSKECGIATFTSDLTNSVSGEYNKVDYEIIALNDPSETCNYSEEVVFQIERDKLKDYYLAADYINQSDADIVCLQHEFGLFGIPLGALVVSHVTWDIWIFLVQPTGDVADAALADAAAG
jgi:hypothetical protein